VLVLLVASIPAFAAEAKLAGESFRLYSWRAPEGRRLNYLEWILTRDSHVKEVKLFDLGSTILGRYRALFQKFYSEDKRLAYRRMAWGLGLGLVSLLAFYGCYALVAGRAARAEISLPCSARGRAPSPASSPRWVTCTRTPCSCRTSSST
jgi:ATP-binding cassette subfamily B protein